MAQYDEFDIIDEEEHEPRRTPLVWLWLGIILLLTIFGFAAGIAYSSLTSRWNDNPTPLPNAMPSSTIVVEPEVSTRTAQAVAQATETGLEDEAATETGAGTRLETESDVIPVEISTPIATPTPLPTSTPRSTRIPTATSTAGANPTATVTSSPASEATSTSPVPATSTDTPPDAPTDAPSLTPVPPTSTETPSPVATYTQLPTYTPESTLTPIPTLTATETPPAADNQQPATNNQQPAALLANLEGVRPTENGRFLAAYNDTIQLDGRIEDWSNRPAAWRPLKAVVYGGQHYDGPADLSAGFQAAWSADGLYFALIVLDDLHRSGPSNQELWQGDSLELHFDQQLRADFDGDTTDEDDYQIGINYGPHLDHVNAYRWAPAGESGPIPVTGALSSATGGYIVEFLLTWDAFGLTPGEIGPESIYGFNLSVNDNDSDQPAQQTLISASPQRTTYNNPTEWGTLLLGP